MTKKEIMDYIDSLGKETGEFTEEELYDIGCKYKTLPVSEKRWEELVKILGVDKTGEQFRIWIKGRQYADGTITKNVQLISGQTIDGMTFPEFEEKTEEIKQELYKQQVKTRDSWNAYRQDLRKEARVEDFQDLLLNSIKAMKPFNKVQSPVVSKTSVSEAVMLFSDVHLGVKLDTFYNKYNVEVARERIHKYVQDTIEYCHRHNVQRLNFLNLGDNIAGLIHITGRLEQEINVVEQITQASEILAEALNELQEAAPEIIYRSCTDNHSRAIGNYKENLEAENFGKIIDFYLKARLQDTNIVFAQDNLDDEIGLFELLNGKKLLFIHGHHDNYNNVAQAYLGATKEYIDYICLGHYHSSKLKTFQGIKVIVNGSIVGSEQYAYSKRLFGDPEQTLMIFDGDNVSLNYINLK